MLGSVYAEYAHATECYSCPWRVMLSGFFWEVTVNSYHAMPTPSLWMALAKGHTIAVLAATSIFCGAAIADESDSIVWLSGLTSRVCDSIAMYGSGSGKSTRFCATAALGAANVAAMRDEPNSRGMAVWEAVMLPLSEDGRRRLKLNENGRLGITDRKVRRDLRKLGIDGDAWYALKTTAIQMAAAELNNRRTIFHERICDRRSSFETKEALGRAIYDSGSVADVELVGLVESALSTLPPDTVEIVVNYALAEKPTFKRTDADAFTALQAHTIQDMDRFIDHVICW